MIEPCPSFLSHTDAGDKRLGSVHPSVRLSVCFCIGAKNGHYQSYLFVYVSVIRELVKADNLADVVDGLLILI